jgi:hypothetical protein
LTTVLSIKARLEPMMVAARIQGLAFARQGASASADRMKASSHGGLMDAIDAAGWRSDAQDCSFDWAG